MQSYSSRLEAFCHDNTVILDRQLRSMWGQSSVYDRTCTRGRVHTVVVLLYEGMEMKRDWYVGALPRPRTSSAAFVDKFTHSYAGHSSILL